MWLKLTLLCIFGATNSMTTSFEVGGVLSGNRMAGVPLGRSLGNGELDMEGICAEAGTACLNCTHAITCVPLPVGYLKVPLQKCQDGQTCNAHVGQCSDVPVPECEEKSRKYQHTCEQVGIFPDAYDCRKFHLCSPPEGSPFLRPADHRTALCPRHYGYDPQTAQCSIKLHKGQCSQKQVNTCNFVGESGPLLLSPNYYFICLRKDKHLYPQIFLCPYGWYFWDGFCHPDRKPEVTTESTTVGRTPKKVHDLETGTTDKINILTETKVAAEKKDVKKEVAASTTLSWIDLFFSTEKATTYAADAFLADKFDLTNYESTDDVQAPSYDFANSFERSNEFW